MGSTICGSKDNKFIVSPNTPTHSLPLNLEATEVLFKEPSEALHDLILLELSIKCTNLYTEDRFQLLNPIAHILIKEDNTYVLKSSTEVENSTLNPIFKKKIRVSYKLKKLSSLKIEVYHHQPKKLGKMLIGSCITTLHEIVSKPEALSLELLNQNKRSGFVIITASEMKFLNDSITMQ